MSDANDSQAAGNKIIFPDITELWKEMYFKTEGAWADAFKEFVSTDTFVKMLDQTLNQHLSLEKTSRQNVDKLFELSAAPSKKDLARIAELVISVEEKVDNLDYQLLDNVSRMADGLLAMSGLMEKNQQQFAALNAQNTELYEKINEIQMQNTEMQNQITNVIIQNAELQSQMGNMENQHSGVKTQLADLKKQNTQLKTQLTDMKKQVTAFNQKLTVINGKNEGVSKKTRSSNDKLMPTEQAEFK